MSADVGTTPRKPLTPRQRLRLFESRRGICDLCHAPIRSGDRWIDEHMTALGLGGSNDPENRGIAHKACAADKTNGPEGDLAKIAAAKRVKQKHLGIRVESARPIQSAGFAKSAKAAARAAKGHRQAVAIRLPPGFEPASSSREPHHNPGERT